MKNPYKVPDTPNLEFDFESGYFTIKGSSYPEDTVEFYDPLIKEFKSYFEKAKELSTLTVYLKYINTGSERMLFFLLKVFNDAFEAGKKVKINWAYDEADYEIREIGENFKKSFSVPFNLISTKN